MEQNDSKVESRQQIFFALALTVSFFCIFYGIEDYPIYFFCDEAFFPNTANDLLNNGLKGSQGELLPMYYEAAPRRWTPTLPVYFHMIPLLAFERTVFLTRAVSALFSCSALFAASLIVRRFEGFSFWWLTPLFFTGSCGWLMHSRTAFETMTMAAFFLWTILFYQGYVKGHLRQFYLAVLCGFAGFYSYSNGHVIFPLLVGALLLLNFRTHIAYRGTVLKAIFFGLLLLTPAFRLLWLNGNVYTTHLKQVNPQIKTSTPLETVETAGKRYVQALSPGYWFVPNNVDIERHSAKDRGHLPVWYAPFIAAGLCFVLYRVKRTVYLPLLMLTLIAPLPAAMAGLGFTRLSTLASCLCIFSAIGMNLLAGYLRRFIPWMALSILLFAGLSLHSLNLLNTFLTRGWTWYHTFGLYGAQYGTRQAFGGVIRDHLTRFPDAKVQMSPAWLNGPDRARDFFLRPDQAQRISFKSPDDLLRVMLPLGPNDAVFAAVNEYNRLKDSPLFTRVEVLAEIKYPNGEPGLFLLRPHYAPNALEIFAREREIRSAPVVTEGTISGQKYTASHSRIDMGSIKNLFDGDEESLIRGLESNPFLLHVTLESGLPADSITLRFSHSPIEVKVTVVEVNGASSEFSGQKHEDVSVISLPLGRLHQIREMKFSFRDTNFKDMANIHLYEITLGHDASRGDSAGAR